MMVMVIMMVAIKIKFLTMGAIMWVSMIIMMIKMMPMAIIAEMKMVSLKAMIMAMMTIMKAIKIKYDGSADNDVSNNDPNNGNDNCDDDYHTDSDYEDIEDFVNGDNDALKMIYDDEQNRTEILYELQHYKLIVTSIHNIRGAFGKFLAWHHNSTMR